VGPKKKGLKKALKAGGREKKKKKGGREKGTVIVLGGGWGELRVGGLGTQKAGGGKITVPGPGAEKKKVGTGKWGTGGQQAKSDTTRDVAPRTRPQYKKKKKTPTSAR